MGSIVTPAKNGTKSSLRLEISWSYDDTSVGYMSCM